MKRTSAAVLALLFALPAQAVRLDSDDLVQLDRKAKADQLSPENMDPWVYKFSKENMDNFPQFHTPDQTWDDKSAYLAQTKHHRKHHKKDIGERGYDEEVHGFVKEVIPPLNTRVRSTLPFIPNGSDPSAFQGSASFNEKKHHHKHHTKDIAERGIDTDVQQFVWEAMPPLNGRERGQYETSKADLPFIPNGSDPSSFKGSGNFNQRKHHSHRKPDVAERGMDEEVHGFVKEYTSPINEMAKSDKAFIPNGSDPSAFDPSFAEHKHHSKHHKKDIGERGYDEEVHGFVKEFIPPLNTRVRSTLPFIPNGSDPSAFQGSASFNQHHHRHHKKPDVAERGMDEEVHGFVKEYTSPINEMAKSDKAFIPNGSDSSAFDPSFAEHKHHRKHHKKDVAERGMDEEVHGFVWHALPPLNTWVRSDDPFVPNGSDPSAIDPDGLAFAQNKHHHHSKDIAERAMEDHFVHPFSNDQDVVMPTPNPWLRPYLPYQANGGSNVYSQLKHKNKMRDIYNGEVRPDVYTTVHKMINPVAMGRFREPRPEEAPEDRVWDDGPKPKEEPTPPFKFKMPDYPDEEDYKAKAKARAEEGHQKYLDSLKKEEKEQEEGDDEYGPKLPKKDDKSGEKGEKAEEKEDKEGKEKEANKDKADKKEADEADKEEKESAENKKKKEGEAKKD